jgi:D-alanyl-D-alanine carboxypeptidase (penicillin-binding protein 5/6)
MNDDELQQMYEHMTPQHELCTPMHPDEHAGVYEGNVVRDKIIAFIAAFSLTGLVVLYSTMSWSPEAHSQVTQSVGPEIAENIPQPPDAPNPFRMLDIEAEAVAVYDINVDTFLFARRADEQRGLASLTKLMTGLLVVESYDIERRMAVAPGALQAEGDTGLLANETWRVRDLIQFTMLTSSNDGANALATAVGSLWVSTPAVSEATKRSSFVAQMNTRARELGLTQSTYRNPTGLDVTLGTPGAVGSAADTSRLLAHIWQHAPEVIDGTNEYSRTLVSEDGFVHQADNTNEFVTTIPGLMGSKTGYTDLAGGNLAVVYDVGLNHPIVVVVLGSSLDGRFTDVDALVEATYEYIESGWYAYEVTAGSTPRS